jgi:formate hydrogenlyase subunit 6/NADH:ubiquinone oxidoreductase subunit I
MGIDVRAYAMATPERQRSSERASTLTKVARNQDVKRAACVGCGMCGHMCPRGVLKLEKAKNGAACPTL